MLTKFFFLVLFYATFHSCASLQNLTEKSEFSFEPPNIRIERFPETFNLKGKGQVRCAENVCNEFESKMPKLKALPKNGLWEEYSEREIAGGKKLSFLIKKGQYTDNQPTGIWEEYSIKEDVQSGIFYSVLDKKGKYADGKREGLWQYFYDEGPNATKQILLKETYFKAGLKEGIEKRYNREGLVIEESNYVNDKLHGKYIKKTPKGILLVEGEYNMDQKTGEWKEYQEEKEGALKSITNYKNDKKHGKQILYYLDGKTKLAEGNFENGLETGVWKYFYENGKLEKEGSYFPEFYEDEESKADPKKPKAKRKGVWKKYYRNGNLFSEGILDGKPVGEWRFYYNNGKLAAKGVMRNEFMLAQGSLFDVMGNLTAEGNFMMSMIKLNEQTQEIEITYKPKVPFTLYKSGKKYMELTPEIENGYNVALLYSENGDQIGKGPIEVMTQKKNGCWNMNGKKVFYMMDKVTTGAMAKMNNCE